jgi:hypothetical protein
MVVRRTGPPGYVAWLPGTQFQTRFQESILAPQRDLSFQLGSSRWPGFTIFLLLPDQCCGPGCFSQIPDPNFSPSASKNLSILTPKKWFLISRKYDPGCSSRIPNLFFILPISEPGSRGQKDTGSRIRIRNTVPDTKSAFSLGLLAQQCRFFLKSCDRVETTSYPFV